MKPPILRKLEVKNQQSEIFYNSENSRSSNQNVNKNVSKSCNDIESAKKLQERPQLQDSLKIFRNINPISVPKVVNTMSLT
jgi:hypothetical protein